MFIEETMLLFFLFVVLGSVSAYFIFQLSNTISIQKRQLLLLTRQNNNLKSAAAKQINQKTIIIKYIVPAYTFGIIAKNCYLYAAPIENSTIINELNKNTQIKIIDSAEVENCIWYEVSSNFKDNINNKGWIKAENIMLYDNHTLTHR